MASNAGSSLSQPAQVHSGSEAIADFTTSARAHPVVASYPLPDFFADDQDSAAPTDPPSTRAPSQQIASLPSTVASSAAHSAVHMSSSSRAPEEVQRSSRTSTPVAFVAQPRGNTAASAAATVRVTSAAFRSTSVPLANSPSSSSSSSFPSTKTQYGTSSTVIPSASPVGMPASFTGTTPYTISASMTPPISTATRSAAQFALPSSSTYSQWYTPTATPGPAPAATTAAASPVTNARLPHPVANGMPYSTPGSTAGVRPPTAVPSTTHQSWNFIGSSYSATPSTISSSVTSSQPQVSSFSSSVSSIAPSATRLSGLSSPNYARAFSSSSPSPTVAMELRAASPSLTVSTQPTAMGRPSANEVGLSSNNASPNSALRSYSTTLSTSAGSTSRVELGITNSSVPHSYTYGTSTTSMAPSPTRVGLQSSPTYSLAAGNSVSTSPWTTVTPYTGAAAAQLSPQKFLTPSILRGGYSAAAPSVTSVSRLAAAQLPSYSPSYHSYQTVSSGAYLSPVTGVARSAAPVSNGYSHLWAQ
eukprot:RCo041288